MLNDRWTEVLAAEEYGLSVPDKSHHNSRWLPQYDGKALEPTPPPNKPVGRPQFGPGKAAAPAEHHTNPSGRPSKNKEARGDTRDIQQEPDTQNRHTDRGDMPRPVITVIYSDTTNPSTLDPKTVSGVRLMCFTVWPNIEEPHTLFASPTR